MAKNHRNEDGSYTWYVSDEKGCSVPITIPAGTIADGLEGIDVRSNSSDFTWRHLLDWKFYRGAIEEDDSDGDTDNSTNPMDSFVHPGPSVEDQAIGVTIEESVAIVETRRIISNLKPKLKDTYFKRYECNWTQEDAGKAEGKGKSTICMREKTIQRIVREQLRDAGIDESNIATMLRKQ